MTEHTHEHEHHHIHDEHCGCGHHHAQAEDYHANHGIELNFQGVSQADVPTIWSSLTHSDWLHEGKITAFTGGAEVQHGEQSFMLTDIDAPDYIAFTWYNGVFSIELQELPDAETLIDAVYWVEHPEDVTEAELESLLHSILQLEAHASGQTLTEEEAAYVKQQVPELMAELSAYIE